jgi:AcrR family transcriptional regulator
VARAKALSKARDIPTEVKDPALVSARRRQIVDAAVGLFIAQGFHKTTTRQIAKAAGLAIGTMYEYVKSKEDVLYLVCEAIHGEVAQRLERRLAHQGSGAAAVEAAIEVYYRVCHQMSDHILLIYQESGSLPPESLRVVLEHEQRLTETFAELLRTGAADYSLRPLDRREVELMAHNIVVLGHMWVFRRWSLGRRFSLEEYTRRQRELIMGQLA